MKSKKPIVLYSTGCVRCKTLAQMLDKANIDYIVNNTIDEMHVKGISSVPVLEVDGEMYGYEEAKNWIMTRKKLKG